MILDCSYSVSGGARVLGLSAVMLLICWVFPVWMRCGLLGFLDLFLSAFAFRFLLRAVWHLFVLEFWVLDFRVCGFSVLGCLLTVLVSLVG